MRDDRPARTVHRRAILVAALAVSGLGVTSAQALAATGGFVRGSEVFDTTVTAKTSTLKNTSPTETLNVTGPGTLVGPSGVGPAPSFKTSADTCAPAPPATTGGPTTPRSLAPLAECTVTVSFSGGAALAGAVLKIETDAGTKSVQLRANAPDSTVCVTGQGCGTKKSLSGFSAAANTPSAAQTFQIRNGNADVSKASLTGIRVDVVTGPYTVDTSRCGEVVVGASCDVIVTFTPSAAGTFPGMLRVVSNDPITPGPSITLTGTATPAAPGPGTPGGPPAPGTPGGPNVTGQPPFAAKLEVLRARVLRTERRLDVLAPITARASGDVKVSFQAAGRTDRFSAAVDPGNSRIRINQRITASQARLGTGILTITYPGDADTQPQEVRLRAASGKANLRAGRPTISGGRLTASGTISTRARGVVRVQMLFEPPGQPTRTLQFNARISNGRYRVSETLPADVVAQIAARRGVVHSYTLFTGYLPANMRGEMASFQVLGAR